MSKNNAHFSKLISSNKYKLIPDEISTSNKNNNNSNNDDANLAAKRAEKKRKRAERKKKYFDRKKAQKDKERAEREEEEFRKNLDKKLNKSDKHFEDLPEEYRKLIGGDFEHTHMVNGLDYGLLRQTKEKIAKTHHGQMTDQDQDIEYAYQNTNNDNDNDLSMILDISTTWAHDIHKTVMKYFNNDNPSKQRNNQTIVNRKFANGMVYKFNIDQDDIPTEIIRSQSDYGLTLDEFSKANDNSLDTDVCSGYTPIETRNKIKNAFALHRNGKKKDIDNKKGKKRTFSDMEQDKKAVGVNVMDIDDDFDIFADVGRDYVCNMDQERDPKRRKVGFITPEEERIQKLKEEYQLKMSYFDNNDNSINNSSVKYEAANILKSSLDKAKLQNLKLKRAEMAINMNSKSKILPKKSILKNKDKNVNPNRLKGLSSIISFGDDIDDDFGEIENDKKGGYDSDDDDKRKQNVKTSANTEWKSIQNKFNDGKSVSKSIKNKLNNTASSSPKQNFKRFFS